MIDTWGPTRNLTHELLDPKIKKDTTRITVYWRDIRYFYYQRKLIIDGAEKVNNCAQQH